MFLEDTQIGPGLKNLLKFKEVGSFQEFFEILKDGKELDIAFVFLYQLLKGNKHLQDKIQDHTEVTLHGFKSLEVVVTLPDVLLIRHTTNVCVILVTGCIYLDAINLVSAARFQIHFVTPD